VTFSKLFSIASLLFITGVPALDAQSYQGGIRGKVADSAAGAVATAKVSLIDEGTNTQRSTISNDSGEFVFNAVDPARYTLTTEAPGFKKFERKGIVVETQAFLTIDVMLEVGSVTESINVTEEVPLMNTSNASTGQVVDNQKLIDLPNLGRNPFMMAKIAENIVQVGDPRFNRMQDQSGSSQISIAGGPVRGNNYLLDGVPITDTVNRAVIIPTIEAVQEVKIQANTYDAEMGRTGGGVFNTFLKSGSNQYHGSVFGYTRQTDWVANSFFNNRNGVPRPNQPFYNFGASLGGPVIIPKLYDGRNKTFLWFGAEAYRQSSGLSRETAVPTLLERSGDFSKSLNKSGTLQTIYDPLTTRTAADGSILRDPFPGNVIPSGRINNVGSAIAQYFPTPGRAPRYLGDTDYLGAGVLYDRADQGTAKLDQEVRSWWHANLSYLHYKSREPGGNLFGTIAAPGASLLYRKVDATQVNSILTPNPTTVVSVRYGFNRFPNFTIYESSGFNPERLGFPSSFVQQLQYLQFPSITMQTMTNLGAGGASWSVYHSRNFLVGVSKFIGRHSLKAGFDYRLLHIDFINYGAAGSFSFSDQFTRRDPNKADGTGSDIASLLLGAPASGTASIATKFFQFIKYYAGYVHDDIRITPKLTLNLGLRYEYESGPQEAHNHFISGFDPNVASPLGPPAKGGVMYAGVNGKSECCSPSNLKFAPRFGAAYALNDKTTLRGGYGMFWAPIAFSGLTPVGYTQNTDYVGSFDGGQTPAGTLSNPFPNGLSQPVGNTLGLMAGVGSSVTYPYNNSGSTRVQQFSFDIQRQIGSVTVAAGYVGSRTANLILGTGTVNFNQLDPANFSQGSALLQLVANPFYQKGGAGVIAPAKVQLQQLLRPFPQFSSVSATLVDKNHAKYDSLVLKTQKRMSAGLTFVASWTYSKNMDGSFGATNYFLSGSTAPQNAYNLGAEYALAIVNTPSSFKSGASYELPFGKGKTFLNGSRLMDEVVGGWQINVVNLIQTGFPLPIIQDQNLNSVLGAGVQRPNATGASPGTSGALESRLDGYINPAAFSSAPQFTFGNLSRTIGLRSPGTVNFDLSVIKKFSIYERFSGQFRAEAINAFNTPQFNGPNTNFGNVNFGKITQQGNFPRYLQLGVRMTF
jgi:hypothetical protein